MVPKRPFHEDGDDGLGAMFRPPKRTFKNTVIDVMRGQSIDEFVARMVPFFRRVVREELDRVIMPGLLSSERPPVDLAETSGVSGLQLQIVGKLPTIIYTGSRIETEDGDPLRIFLLDASTNTVVTSGPLSSIKVEIAVIDGDFGYEDHEDWTEKDFNDSLVREREGKRPLVTGELNITLVNGAGIIGDVVFTDNSSWIRCRKFRLGVRALQKLPNGVRIREAKTEAVVVKDHRGEVYKKHYPPSLNDEVWRLEKIGRNGAIHKRLDSYGITTVKDFLQLHEIDPSSLRSRISTGVSNKIWDTIVEHASSCVLDGKLYGYSGQGVGLLFNTIYKLVGATFDGQNYVPLDKLTFPQKLSVENLKHKAYRNLNQLVLIDDQALAGPSRPLAIMQAEPFTATNKLPVDFAVEHLDQQETQLGVNPCSTTSASYNEPEDYSQQEVSVAQSSQPVQVFTPAMRNSFRVDDFLSLPYNEELGHFPTEEISHFQTSTWSPFSNPWGQGNAFVFTSGDQSELDLLGSLPRIGVRMCKNSKPKARWCKVRAAIILRSVGRHAAAKRMASLFYV